VALAWVFFRATSFDAALRVLHGMAGLGGAALPVEWHELQAQPWAAALPFAPLEAFGGLRQLGWIAVLLLVVWTCPNSQTLMSRLDGLLRARVAAPARRERWGWFSLGGMTACVFLLAAISASHGISEFIYFNF